MLAAVSVVFVRRGWWDTAGWLWFFNIVHNAYPVLSLRAVRARSSGCVSPLRRTANGFVADGSELPARLTLPNQPLQPTSGLDSG